MWIWVELCCLRCGIISDIFMQSSVSVSCLNVSVFLLLHHGYSNSVGILTLFCVLWLIHRYMLHLAYLVTKCISFFSSKSPDLKLFYYSFHTWHGTWIKTLKICPQHQSETLSCAFTHKLIRPYWLAFPSEEIHLIFFFFTSLTYLHKVINSFLASGLDFYNFLYSNLCQRSHIHLNCQRWNHITNLDAHTGQLLGIR